MEDIDYKKLAKDIVDWFMVEDNYSVVHWGVENGFSKEDLFTMASEDAVFKKALEFGFSVQEYKVVDGAIKGKLDKTSAMKMLETYNGWKSDVSIYQNISQTISPELAKMLTEAIGKMDSISKEINESMPTDTFGEIDVSCFMNNDTDSVRIDEGVSVE